MLEYVLYSINYKLHVSAGSGHHQVLSIQKRFKMALYNLCNGVLMNRSHHQYSVSSVFISMMRSLPSTYRYTNYIAQS